MKKEGIQMKNLFVNNKAILFTVLLIFMLLISIPILAEENSITVSFSFPVDEAQIGKPFPIQYSVQGGSGSYKDLYFDVALCTGPGRVYDDIIENVDSTSGTWYMNASVGKTAIIYFGGVDVATNEPFYKEAHKEIVINENPDYTISITFDKEEYNINDVVNGPDTLGCQSSLHPLG